MALTKIKFQTNIAVEVTLKFAEGKLCDSQFGDPQYMFTTDKDEVFFVAEKVAAKIHGLHLKPHEPLTVMKAEKDYGNGRKGIEWIVERVGFAPGEVGEQPNGTFKVLAGKLGQMAVNGTAVPPAAPPKATAKQQQQPIANGNGNNNGHSNGNSAPPEPDDDPRPRVLQPWAQFLLQQTNQLIDVYALALKRAGEQHGGTVRGEDVRSIMLSSFINVSKNGGANVA